MAADGQVSLGSTVMKERARKVRTLASGRVLAGFAGASADAFTLLDRFESKLEAHQHNLARAAVELAKDWRMDRYLRKLEAMLIVMDATSTLLLSGTGDVIEPDEGVIAIGSGGNYALASARALLRHTSMSAADVARESLRIASEICIYTNDSITLEELPS
jgi:ATP-dependent HslUV protease subunit HslV